MTTTAQQTKNNISLKGSTDTVVEFFGYAVNSILYQRGIYPPESFDKVKKYGLSMMITSEVGLKKYLDNVLVQLKSWMMNSVVQQLVIVITGVEKENVLERWVFDVETDKKLIRDTNAVVEKSEKEITGEIQAIIRQITASVSFLPLLEDACTFDLLVITDQDLQVPQQWEESDPKYIPSAEQVTLRSFTTKIHKVSTSVSYAVQD
jgi:mitotic spindle assembly checkpoint protein MAD2